MSMIVRALLQMGSSHLNIYFGGHTMLIYSVEFPKDVEV
jgi:hypothetical protein